MPQIPLITSQIARPMVAYLDANGVDTTTYLDRARIPGELIESGGWIAKKQLYDMLYDVEQRERHPGIILSAFSGFQIDDAAPIADAIKSARTLKDALRVVTRLAGLVYEGNEYFLRSEGETTWLCHRERTPVSAGTEAGQQGTLAIFLKMIRLLAGCQWRPDRVRGPIHIEKGFQTTCDWEQCQRIHQDNYLALALPTSLMQCELPLVQMSQSVDEADSQWHPDATFDDQFVESLHRFIASRFTYCAFPTLEQVSAIVGVSTRTIKRHLASAGLSYRHLLDRICFDAARQMLRVENCSVKETASALGYADTSKFVRSFRRMTGVTPGEYQRRLQ